MLEVLRRFRRLNGSSSKASFYAPQKLKAIRSYENFTRTGQTPAHPLEVFLELSNICDLKCAMCWEFSAINKNRLNNIARKGRGFLEKEAIAGSVETVLPHALLVHCFGYGEPTIHPQFREFIDFLSQYEVAVDFFTNGMHLDDSLANFLVERDVYKVVVSFSGATREDYENTYIGGDFDRVLSGLARVAAAKKARNSIYPIIEINSLGFKHHIEKLPAFVALMADNGANVIHVKQLTGHSDTPQIYEHVSIMRPWVEGVTVAEAVALGRQRGVHVAANQYLSVGVKNEAEYATRIAELTALTNAHANDAPYREAPAVDFHEIARAAHYAKPVVGKTVPKADASKRALGGELLPVSGEISAIAEKLGIEHGPPKPSDTGFYCMEPFKTMYVTRRGGIKPCCFSGDEHFRLGYSPDTTMAEIWSGAPFEALRQGIMRQSYPKSICGHCIKNRNGPPEQHGHLIIEAFMAWHRACRSSRLGRSMTFRSPRWRLNLRRTSGQIVRRAGQYAR
jgi:uncharacterized Fe-S cluster-containing radical SAM superfamily protein